MVDDCWCTQAPFNIVNTLKVLTTIKRKKKERGGEHVSSVDWNIFLPHPKKKTSPTTFYCLSTDSTTFAMCSNFWLHTVLLTGGGMVQKIIYIRCSPCTPGIPVLIVGNIRVKGMPGHPGMRSDSGIIRVLQHWQSQHFNPQQYSRGL